jgi:hypothetical protein
LFIIEEARIQPWEWRLSRFSGRDLGKSHGNMAGDIWRRKQEGPDIDAKNRSLAFLMGTYRVDFGRQRGKSFGELDSARATPVPGRLE